MLSAWADLSWSSKFVSDHLIRVPFDSHHHILPLQLFHGDDQITVGFFEPLRSLYHLMDLRVQLARDEYLLVHHEVQWSPI